MNRSAFTSIKDEGIMPTDSTFHILRCFYALLHLGRLKL